MWNPCPMYVFIKILSVVTHSKNELRSTVDKANSISMSAYARRYRDDSDRLIKTLKQLIKFFTLWKSLQKLWAYMTPIFYGSELGAQMVKQYDAF